MEPPSAAAVSRQIKTRPSRGGTAVAPRSPSKGGAWETLRFGDVTITARRPAEAEIRANVEASSAALKRALPRLLDPGVRIYAKKDVPLYWADPDNPEEGFIRKLNGKTERGVLDDDGVFKAAD